MANAELHFRTNAPQTQLNQDTAHRATLQKAAPPDFHVWHTTLQTV